MSSLREIRGALNALFGSLPTAGSLLRERTRASGNEHMVFGRGPSNKRELEFTLNEGNQSSVDTEDSALRAGVMGYGPYALPHSNEPFYSAHSHPGQIASPSLPDLTLMSIMETLTPNHPDQHTMAIFGVPDPTFPEGIDTFSTSRFKRSGVPRGWMPYLNKWPAKMREAIARGAIKDPEFERSREYQGLDVSPLVSGQMSLPLRHLTDKGAFDYNLMTTSPDLDDLYDRVYEQLQRARAFDYAHGGLTHG